VDADQKKRVGVLAGLLAALVAVLAWQLWPSAFGAGAAGTAARQGAGTPAPPGIASPEAPGLDVRLEKLEAGRREPEETGRDPFRFLPRPPPAPPAPPPPAGRPTPGNGTAGSAVDPSQPAPPPPPPPITLKFIGVVTRETKAKIAVLSDGRFVFHGREGDIIEGRYRVVRIGEESVQMEYVDGRGRQTIRLSGS
jgi:hypothetical protein